MTAIGHALLSGIMFLFSPIDFSLNIYTLVHFANTVLYVFFYIEFGSQSVLEVVYVEIELHKVITSHSF